MTSRGEVADFWDDVLARWVDDRDHLIPPLPEWLNSYSGTGKGAVDVGHFAAWSGPAPEA